MSKSDKTISITLTGPQGSGHASFADFERVCSGLKSCLSHIERCVTGSEGKIEFDIVGLTHASASVCLSPTKQDTPSVDVVNVAQETFSKLENASPIDDRLDFYAIRAFSRLRRSSLRNGAYLIIGNLTLSSQFDQSIDKLLDFSMHAYGSVSGRLDGLNVHNKSKRRFILYPYAEKEEIDCFFHESDMDRVREAIEKKVTVFGNMSYSQKKIFPVAVQVDDFEIDPEDNEIGSILELRGALKNTSGESTEIIRKLRDEWET